MFVDIYAIQNVPPSNINRDDTGSPKTAYYGGTLRSRVSSQAWKKAIRHDFQNMLPDDSLGVRTKTAVALIKSRITEQRPDLQETAEGLAQAVLMATGVKVVKSGRAGLQEGQAVTQYLIFIGKSELNNLANVAIRWADEQEDINKISPAMKKEVSQVFSGTKAVDVALFGRMLADAPELNTDASAQVAHAISVDEIEQEYDYFTAMDDCATDDNAGAAMIDTVGFNSSTLYRYATVNVDAFAEQLGDAKATAQGVQSFVTAFAKSMPTGKQNTFGNRTLPSSIVIAVRDTQPVNAVDAFQDAIRGTEHESVSRKAAQRLGIKLQKIEEAYADKPLASWNIVVGEPVKELDAVSEAASLPDAVAKLYDFVLGELEKKE